MQGNGAEMLRLACCLTTERGISICAPVHDAIVIEAPESELSEVVSQTQKAMVEASEVVLASF
jgi:DNA polymerase I-like protein with 3'-5' exonuclease and polymerase domains